MKRTLFAITFLIFTIACPAPKPVDNNSTPKPATLVDTEIPNEDALTPKYQWVQFGADNDVVVRAIFDQSNQNCPDIKTTSSGKNKISMKNRTNKMPVNFTDITVCEATLGKLDTIDFTATLSGKSLPIPTTNPKKIMTVGDTGCRIRSQDCSSEWFFAKTVDDIAKDPKLIPDQIIHVGDYIYRECSDENKCGKDDGRNWKMWEADFFEPAKDLLEKVPWVFARGNHESCMDHGVQREWRGWFLFLDPYSLSDDSFDTGCNGEQFRSKPFQVSLDGLDLIVMDSAVSATSNDYDDAFKKHTGSSPAWLITHRPSWGVGSGFSDSPPTGVIASAIANDFKFLIAGHIHAFEWIEFNDKNVSPPQMVVGGGATKLETFSQKEFDIGIKKLEKHLENIQVSDSDITGKYIHKEFTYAIIGSDDKAWQITLMDEEGETEMDTFSVSR